MIDKIINIVKDASKIYKSAKSDLSIEVKGDDKNNLVTKYDKEIQDFLINELKRLYPDASFFGEEGNGKKEVGDGYCFIIDPIDGTTNFIKGFEHSAISVGLAKDKEIILGVVYDVDKDNMYYAKKGYGAYLNGRKISASSCDLKSSVVMFGTCPYDRELSHKTFQIAENVFQTALEIRRSGSAALDICYVASGKADLYFELIISPWDWAGASIIAKEAGAKITTMELKELSPNEKTTILVGNNKNIKEFFEII